MIERAVGASRLFGSIAPDLLRDPKSCANNLRRVVSANPEYSFIGVVPLTGFAVCSSSNEIVDFRNAPGFKKALAAQEPAITAIEAGPASAHSVFVVFEPFDIDGEFAGFVSVSIPHSGLPDTSERLEDLGLEELITFNEAGKILTTRSNVDEAQHEMPAGTTLAGLSTEEPRTFRSKNVDGVERRYSIVTIAGSPASCYGRLADQRRRNQQDSRQRRPRSVSAVDVDCQHGRGDAGRAYAGWPPSAPPSTQNEQFCRLPPGRRARSRQRHFAHGNRSAGRELQPDEPRNHA